MQNNKWNVLDTDNLQMSNFQVSFQLSALDWQLDYNNNGQRACWLGVEGGFGPSTSQS